MKKFLALLMLVALAIPAEADEFSLCKRWVDESGAKRIKCDFDKIPTSMPPLKREYQFPTSVTISSVGESGNFTIRDHTNGITRMCHKDLTGRVDCW